MQALVEQSDLYQAIFERHSVRRYAQQPLSEETLTKIATWVDEVEALIPENRFAVLIRDVVTGDDLVKALGAYGRVLSPPHFMVPYIMGRNRTLTDLGYRTQQIVIRLAREGIGSCYIGGLARETTLRARFVLRRQARIGVVVLLGQPATALGGRAINAVMRTAMGSTNRDPLDSLFYQKNFRRSTDPPDDLVPLLEAARHAPSALNVQPWRFLWRRPWLYVFVRRENPAYGKGVKQNYKYLDAGVCMANLGVTLGILDLPVAWELLVDGQPDVPRYPRELEPIARLRLDMF